LLACLSKRSKYWYCTQALDLGGKGAKLQASETEPQRAVCTVAQTDKEKWHFSLTGLQNYWINSQLRTGCKKLVSFSQRPKIIIFSANGNATTVYGKLHPKNVFSKKLKSCFEKKRNLGQDISLKLLESKSV